MREFKNILIIRTDRIGDVILTSPSVFALKQMYPTARISMLLAPSTKPLVDSWPALDEVLVDDRLGRNKGFLGFLDLAREIKDKRFDLAIVYHTKKRTNLLCWQAGIPYRIGYKNNKFGFLLTHRIEDDRPRGHKHEANYCVDLLKNLEGSERCDFKACEARLADHLFVNVDKSADRWIDDLLDRYYFSEQDKLIVLHPGASDPSKRWPAEKFIALTEKIKEKYPCRFITIGDAKTRDIAMEISGRSKAYVINVCDKTNLAHAVCLLKRADLLISNDSGPVHIAAALGTPVVSIFTRNQPGINPERWRPLGAKSRVVSPPVDMSENYEKAPAAGVNKGETVGVGEVCEAVDALFKLC